MFRFRHVRLVLRWVQFRSSVETTIEIGQEQSRSPSVQIFHFDEFFSAWSLLPTILCWHFVRQSSLQSLLVFGVHEPYRRERQDGWLHDQLWDSAACSIVLCCCRLCGLEIIDETGHWWWNIDRWNISLLSDKRSRVDLQRTAVVESNLERRLSNRFNDDRIPEVEFYFESASILQREQQSVQGQTLSRCIVGALWSRFRQVQRPRVSGRAATSSSSLSELDGDESKANKQSLNSSWKDLFELSEVFEINSSVRRNQTNSVVLISENDEQRPRKTRFVFEIDLNLGHRLVRSFVDQRKCSMIAINGQTKDVILDCARWPRMSFALSISPNVAVGRPAVRWTKFVVTNVAKGRSIVARTDTDKYPRRPICIVVIV